MKEKTQMALGGLILVVGLSIAGYSYLTAGSTELGGQCLTDTECADGTCLSLESESICTMVSGDCPEGFSSQVINVTMQNAAGFSDTSNAYCLPDRLLETRTTGS